MQALLIDDYGGIHGLRDRALLESAVARPRWKAAYEGADLLAQVGALLFGLAKNHAFLDGNKRLALAAADIFLRLNEGRFHCDSATFAGFIERCSDAGWTEDAAIAFVRENASLP